MFLSTQHYLQQVESGVYNATFRHMVQNSTEDKEVHIVSIISALYRTRIFISMLITANKSLFRTRKIKSPHLITIRHFNTEFFSFFEWLTVLRFTATDTLPAAKHIRI
jgi:hypothetical protein